MRKIYLFAMVCLTLVGIISCSGVKGNRVQDFANSFAGYVNANQLDSIKAVYPTANFDSVAPMKADSIQITENNGNYRIDFGGNKWIEAKENEDGTFTVENSKGIAVFPQDKYETAINTGMLNDSIPDTKAQVLLNDSTYFVWLKERAKKSYDNALSLKAGKAKMGTVYGEGWYGWKLPVTVTNNLPIDLKKEDYKIIYYKVDLGGEYSNWKSSRWQASTSGKDLEAGKTIEIIISDKAGNLNGPKAVLKMSLDEYLAKYYKTTGKEYQEYLDSKK